MSPLTVLLAVSSPLPLISYHIITVTTHFVISHIITIATYCVFISLSLSPLTVVVVVVGHIITVTTHCVVISFITTVTTQHVSCITTVTTCCVVIACIIVTFMVVVVVVVVVVGVVVVVLIWASLSVKDTDGQLIGLWRPVTNFASVQLVQCPHTRGQFLSCVPVTFCGTLLPRSSRHYCRWDGTEPYVCCPQQPTSQPLIHKSKVLIQWLLSTTFNMCNTLEQSHKILYHIALFTSGWLPQGPPKTILIQLMLFLYHVFLRFVLILSY